MTLLILFLLVSGSLQAADYSTKIDSILMRHGLESSQMGLKIVRAGDGLVLYEKGADLSLNPASTEKLVTATAALRFLGPNFSFETKFYAREPVLPGEIGDLWIKGEGDPSLLTESLDNLVTGFQRTGIKVVQGDIILDDTFFDHNRVVTYFSNGNGRTYEVMTGPLSFNFNTVEIRASPQEGRRPLLETVPPTSYVELVNEAGFGGGRRASLWASLDPQQSRITVRGRFPRRLREYRFRQGVDDPTLYTGTVIRDALKRAGIEVKGAVQFGTVPADARLISSYASPPLREVLQAMGKHSNNFTAVQLLKSLGARLKGSPGTLEKGREAVGDYLSTLGITPGGYHIANGSGLSTESRLTSSLLVRVLQEAYGAPWKDPFISSLSVGGIDGTLKRRFGGSLKGRLFAKTGSLNEVSALAGYLILERETLIFAMIFNDFSIPSWKVVDVERMILEAVLREVRMGEA